MLILLKITNAVISGAIAALIVDSKFLYAAIAVPAVFLIIWNIKRRRYEGKEL